MTICARCGQCGFWRSYEWRVGIDSILRIILCRECAAKVHAAILETLKYNPA